MDISLFLVISNTNAPFTMSAIPNLPEAVIAGANGAGATNGNTNGFPRKERSGSSSFEISDAPVENHRPIKVIVIGAGYSGIYMGIRIPEKIRNAELVIYEKNVGIGGTWWENRYPGCACDIPSHSYQYSFNPNKNWSNLYAPAHEIQGYLESTAKKYSADRFIKLSHEITSCTWNQKTGKWHVLVRNLSTNTTFEDTSDILISARGNLNHIRWPDIDGLDTFQGEKMHSADWNQDYDFKGKKVGIIGTGSSAIQIVPNLQKVEGTELKCFVRSQTWISPPFGQELWDELGLEGYEIPPEMQKTFTSNPSAYKKFRLAIESGGNSIHGTTLRSHPLQKSGKAHFESHMKSKLSPTHPHILETLLPNFSPGCRRLTPGIGYLESLTQPNVTFISSHISHITPQGIVTKDDITHNIDVLVCATGFHTSSAPPFPMIGKNNISLTQHWKDAGRPSTYLSLATDSFPNHFLILGPNSAIGAGSLTMMIESVGDYLVKCVRKVQKENIHSMAPKNARVRDFLKYCDGYFPGTVYAEDCKSWYKSSREMPDVVTGLWPGSTLHCIEALRSPRWEDWEYVHHGEEEGEDGVVKEGNRMAWLGNGWSDNQSRNGGKGEHMAWYLYEEFLNVPKEGRPEDNEVYNARAFSY